MSILAKITSIVGGAMVLMRRAQTPAQQAYGATPAIPAARQQGIMTLKMPSAHGWVGDHAPTPAAGLKVQAFATGLDHPRWLHVLDNGDVLVAEASQTPRKPRGLMDHAQVATMRRAHAIGESANRITRLRDTTGSGQADLREVFLQDLNQPFGMAHVGSQFYVGNTDGIVAFPFDAASQQVTGGGQKLVDFKPGGHWTRSLLASHDGRKLYAGVGSLTNIGNEGMQAEEGRAAVWELDIASGAARIFAGGLRNPVGLAWEPTTGALWTVVNERDGLGDETPPDYLTSAQEGGFYGWPYSYWDRIVDDRVPQDAALVAQSITPDFALGGHTASLGLCWMPAGTLARLPEGMVIGQHGSWNRATLSGYRVVFVPFTAGRPSGPAQVLLSGFLSDDEKLSYGRPVGVCVGGDGKSLLVADDVGNAVWRITDA
ncbi:butanol dehydrogenase [Ketogulonicigenium robustum]|uniref:Butanol dehydrogenase n=1 Tax=Ketogulonicigenium robustum TaxID=92947 RepID=A0A1W6NWV8_9RHOB|nr:sorbosone dehydrogenase family protein [Ketogulonicigenium robustum]ARO13705.1 butanol dehydrogenase [Ketogulonicigenium robustum]